MLPLEVKSLFNITLFFEVVYVRKSIGEHTIDLRAEKIIKDNGMEGVNDVVWSEIVHIVGQKRSVPSSIITNCRQAEDGNGDERA
jgi:hypothetical protein